MMVAALNTEYAAKSVHIILVHKMINGHDHNIIILAKVPLLLRR
jgi:hypothetical protein